MIHIIKVDIIGNTDYLSINLFLIKILLKIQEISC